MQINGKRIFFFSLILVFFASSFIFINSSHSQENAKELLIAPQKTSVSKKEVVKRLEAMDAALSQAAPVQLPLEIPDPEVVNSGEEAGQAQVKEAWPEIKTPLVVESEWKSMAGVIVWLASLGLISGLGFLSWRRRRLNTENKLKAELTEQIKRAEIEENLRKAIEQGSKQTEKECEQLKDSLESLKSGLQKKDKLLNKQENVYKSIMDEELAKKDKVYEELKDSLWTLKEKLVKKELKEKDLSPEEEKVPWEVKELAGGGKRGSRRLPLTRDFNKMIILRVKSSNLSQSIKAFAKNVSSEGLSFETKKEFKESEPINLRLFFYGASIPSMKIQTHIVWKRKTESMNKYGVSFNLLEEKESLELNRYIETKKEKLVPVEV